MSAHTLSELSKTTSAIASVRNSNPYMTDHAFRERHHLFIFVQIHFDMVDAFAIRKMLRYRLYRSN